MKKQEKQGNNSPPQICSLSTNKSKRGGHLTSKCPSVYIQTFGCQMNVRDSEVIAGLLLSKGSKLAESPEHADVILFNTCSVRQHAEDKVWSEIGRISKLGVRGSEFGENKLRTTNSKLRTPLIGVIGCMAQNYKADIFKRTPQVDFVVGPSDLHKIPEIIKKVSSFKCQVSSQNIFESKIWETDGDIRPDEIYRTGFYEDKEHAYVVISEGCSNFCSYCVVPYVRGELRNRNYQDILREIEEAVDCGITKITLLGQNVNAYVSDDREQMTENRGNIDFIRLLELVSKIKGLKEFSFITSHPKDTSVDLFKAMASLDKLKKYLHLPVQSGSNRILELMNRQYTREHYLKLAEDYKKIVKGNLTTDFIVGFPSETEKDFKETLDLIKAIEFDASFIFKYSPRPHTKAEGLADDVEKKEKENRHKVLLDLQREISKKKIDYRRINDK